MESLEFIRMLLKSSAGKGFFLTFLNRIISSILGVAVGIFIANAGGPELKGLAATYMAIVAISSAMFSFSIGPQTIALRDTIRSNMERASVATAAIVIGSILGCITMVSAFYTNYLSFFIMSATAFSVVSSASAFILATIKSPHLSSGGIIVQQLFTLLSLFILTYNNPLKPSLIYYSYIVGLIMATSYYIFLYLFLFKFQLKPNWLGLLIVVRSGLAWTLNRTLQLLYERMDILLATLVVGLSETGIYSVGAALASLSLVAQLPIALYYTNYFNKNQKHNLRGKFIKISIGIGIGIAGLSSFFGYYFIKLLYGEEFEESYKIGIMLMPGMIALGVLHLIQYDFVFKEMYKSLDKILMFAVCFLLITGIVGGFYFGVSGVAITFSISTIGITLLMNNKIKVALNED